MTADGGTEATSPNGDVTGTFWGMAQRRKFSARTEAVLARIASDRGVTVAELTRPLTAEEKAAEDARGAAEWRAQKVEFLTARIPSIYRDAVPRTQTARDWLQEYRDGVTHRGIVILGERGVGKTWEAYAIVRHLLVELGVPVHVVSAPDLVDKLRPNDDGQADTGIFYATPILVIDDLGAENLSEWGAEQLWRIADMRCNNRLPFIITSNLTKEQFRQRYDDRLVDRLVSESILIEVGPNRHAKRPTPL
jgi:DNA replication protein DnaC